MTKDSDAAGSGAYLFTTTSTSRSMRSRGDKACAAGVSSQTA